MPDSAETFSALEMAVHNRTIVMEINTDVRAQKRIHEQVAQERDLLRTLMDHSPDCIYVKDTESRLVTTNAEHQWGGLDVAGALREGTLGLVRHARARRGPRRSCGNLQRAGPGHRDNSRRTPIVGRCLLPVASAHLVMPAIAGNDDCSLAVRPVHFSAYAFRFASASSAG